MTTRANRRIRHRKHKRRTLRRKLITMMRDALDKIPADTKGMFLTGAWKRL